MAATLRHYAPDHPALPEIDAKIAAGVHTSNSQSVEPPNTMQQALSLPPAQFPNPGRHYRQDVQPAAPNPPTSEAAISLLSPSAPGKNGYCLLQ